MTVQEILAQAREDDNHLGSVIAQIEGEPVVDRHTGASVIPILLVIEGAGHGLSYEVWEWARSPDDEGNTGTYACVLDGYGVGQEGEQMNFRGFRVTGTTSYEKD
jgi:hypothetical protein